MAIQQPSNIAPSSFAGVGGGTVDVSDNVSVSWQVNGMSPMKAFQIVIYPNTGVAETDATPVSDTGIIFGGYGLPFSGTDERGNARFFKYEPGFAWSSWGLSNGNKYKLKITQWWGTDLSPDSATKVIQFSESAFITRKAPVITKTWPSTIGSVSQTFTAEYSQEQGDAIAWVQWELANVDGSTYTEIENTGAVSTSLISYTYDGFLDGETYAVRLTIETENGVQTTTGWQSFSVSYSQEVPGGTVGVSAQQDGSNLLSFGGTFSIPADSGSSTPVYSQYLPSQKSAYFSDGQSASWSKINGEDMSISSPWTMAWRGILSRTKIYSDASSSETQTITLAADNGYATSSTGNVVMSGTGTSATITKTQTASAKGSAGAMATTIIKDNNIRSTTSPVAYNLKNCAGCTARVTDSSTITVTFTGTTSGTTASATIRYAVSGYKYSGTYTAPNIVSSVEVVRYTGTSKAVEYSGKTVEFVVYGTSSSLSITFNVTYFSNFRVEQIFSVESALREYTITSVNPSYTGSVSGVTVSGKTISGQPSQYSVEIIAPSIGDYSVAVAIGAKYWSSESQSPSVSDGGAFFSVADDFGNSIGFYVSNGLLIAKYNSTDLISLALNYETVYSNVSMYIDPQNNRCELQLSIYMNKDNLIWGTIFATAAYSESFTVKSVKVTGEQTVCTAGIAKGHYEFDFGNDYGLSWSSVGTVMLFNANASSLEAGPSTADAVYSDIFKRELGNKYLRRIFKVPGNVSQIKDFGTANCRMVEYSLYYRTAAGVLSAPAKTRVIANKYPCYFLMEAVADDDAPTVFHVLNVWRFGANISGMAVTNNNSPSFQANFTKYPYYQPNSQMPKGGTLQALLSNVFYARRVGFWSSEYTYSPLNIVVNGGVTYYAKRENTNVEPGNAATDWVKYWAEGIPAAAQYCDSVEQMERLYAISESKNAFFLKDAKGNIYNVKPSGAILQTASVKSDVQEVSVSVPWKEVGSCDGLSIIQLPTDEGWKNIPQNVGNTNNPNAPKIPSSVDFVFARDASQPYTSETIQNSKYDTLTIQVSGDFTSAKIALQGKTDNSASFSTISVVNLETCIPTSRINTKGLYQAFGIEGVSEIRMIVQSVEGGSVTVYGRLINSSAVASEV